LTVAEVVALGTTVFVVEMELLAVGEEGEEEVDDQSLWTAPAMTAEVAEEDPCWTIAFPEFHL
jgi:hypothetical protein